MKSAKTARKMLALLSVGCMVLLGSCGGSDSSTSSSTGGQSSDSSTSSSTEGQSSDSGSSTEAWYVQYKGNEVTDGQNLTAYVNDQTAMLVSYDINGTQVSDVSYSSSNDSVISIDSTTGYMSINAAGNASVTASNANDSQTYNFTVYETQAANGYYNYSTGTYEEKAEILGNLEKYAVDNYLTGMTIFSNGGYVVYNSDRYTPIPTSYISGYGWGTVKEGSLSSELANARGGRSNYYQVATTSLYEHANAMDTQGSTVSEFADYFSSFYFNTRLNATNDSYEWYPSLALDNRPIAVDESGNMTSSDYGSRWRIHVRTGDDAPVYRTASTATYNGVSISQWDGRKVTLEDYLTPFKFMLTRWNGQYRAADLTDSYSGSAFSGAANYYNATETDPEDGSVWNDDLWATYMGDEDGLLPDGSRGNIITGTDEDGDFIEFNFMYDCSQFYAMYYLTSNLYSPLPQDFVELWGGENLGKMPTGYSPVDTMLSTGPYYIDEYSTSLITVTRNDQFYEYVEGQNGQFILNDGVTSRKVYNIPGFQWSLVDDNLREQAFANGEVDSYSPSVAYLNEKYNTSSGSNGTINWRRYQTKGDSNFKLNVNAQTQEQWDERFGVDGTVWPHTSDSYYECKPWMSDLDFLDFLSFSLDRQTICESRGSIPTQDYFSDNYLIDPEEGISYNSTDAHKAVLADRYNTTYGYNVTAAKNSLISAIEKEGGIKDLAAAGELEGSGTSTDPWIVNIDMYWMNPEDPDNYDDVFDSIETVFAQVSQENYGGAYALDVNEIAGTSDYMQVYYTMMEGSFDLGFGSISGDEFDPLTFMYVLRSDNFSGFTLNWGADTGALSPDIVYDGQTWSFDGLWEAGTVGANVVDGVSDGAGLEDLEYVSDEPDDRRQF